MMRIQALRWFSPALLCAVPLLTNSAKAEIRVGIELGIPQRCETAYEYRPERVWVEPVYRTCSERRWVDGGYATVCDRVWVAPVTECVTEPVYVPARIETQEIVHGWGRDRWIERVCVVVEPAHYQNRRHEVEITPGHWDQVQRQVWTEGHWDQSQRQELLEPGHWELRSQPVPVWVDRPDRAWLRFDIGHRHH